MKVKDLIEEIEDCRKEYGDDFLEWDVYTEQIHEIDKQHKRDTTESTGKKWGRLTDSEDWEYFECAGFWTNFPDKRIFTINVNY